MGGAQDSDAAPDAPTSPTATAPPLPAAEPLAVAAEEEAAQGEGSAESTSPGSALPAQAAALEECTAAAAQGGAVEQERPATPGSPIGNTQPHSELAPPQAGDAGGEQPAASPCPPSPAESCGSVGGRPAEAAAPEGLCGSPSTSVQAAEQGSTDGAATVITPRPGSPLADPEEQAGEQNQPQQQLQLTPSSAAAAAAGPRPASPAAMQVVGPPAAVSRPVVSRLSLGTAARDSPAMSFNPLSAALTPQHSVRSAGSVPAAAASTGGVGGTYSSCNPLFAGTPGNPTPQSTVTMRTFASRLADGECSKLPACWTAMACLQVAFCGLAARAAVAGGECKAYPAAACQGMQEPPSGHHFPGPVQLFEKFRHPKQLPNSHSTLHTKSLTAPSPVPAARCRHSHVQGGRWCHPCFCGHQAG